MLWGYFSPATGIPFWTIPTCYLCGTMAGSRPLTNHEERALVRWIRHIRPRDRALITCQLFTGFRISEILALTVGHVFFGFFMGLGSRSSRESDGAGRGVARRLERRCGDRSHDRGRAAPRFTFPLRPGAARRRSRGPRRRPPAGVELRPVKKHPETRWAKGLSCSANHAPLRTIRCVLAQMR